MSSSCCSWLCGRKSVVIENENGITKVVRKTTKNGKTVITTTITSNNPHSSSSTGQIEVESTSFLPYKPAEFNGIRELNTKTAPTTGHQFEVECLNEHNRLRALHGCPPLKLNKSLSATAKKWAITMANRNSMNHSNCKYGENLFMCSGYFIDGGKAVESWYNEIKHYNFRKHGFSQKTGHFTQIVWKESKELGVGVEIRGNTTWVVANYDPPGNVSSQFDQNVPRLLK